VSEPTYVVATGRDGGVIGIFTSKDQARATVTSFATQRALESGDCANKHGGTDLTKLRDFVESCLATVKFSTGHTIGATIGYTYYLPKHY